VTPLLLFSPSFSLSPYSLLPPPFHPSTRRRLPCCDIKPFSSLIGLKFIHFTPVGQANIHSEVFDSHIGISDLIIDYWGV